MSWAGWTERHLNWTWALVWLVGSPASYLPASIIGAVHPDLFPLIMIMTSGGLIIWITGWYLRKKNRNLWNLIWLLVPLGVIPLLCLRNLSHTQTSPKANTEKEKHAIWAIYRRESASATPEKQVESEWRMLQYQELRNKGLSPREAYRISRLLDFDAYLRKEYGRKS